MAVSNQKGVLYVVATPIGHLDDCTVRAARVLREADCIAAEDTRHSRRLLQHYGINTPLLSLHEHNESGQCAELLDRMRQGQSIALISDAGTPLISDPGFLLVQAAREAGICVSPVPGPSALIAALSAAGLPTARFCFIGFLPRTASARRALFQRHQSEWGTLACYESCHRIQACLTDVRAVYGEHHRIAIARELTKTYETILSGAVGAIADQLEHDPDMRKGEFVLLLDAPPAQANSEASEGGLRELLQVLLPECSLKSAVTIAVKLTGLPRKQVYSSALSMKGDD